MTVKIASISIKIVNLSSTQYGKVIYTSEKNIENGNNTEKSPGDLRRHAVTQTTVKKHRQTLL